jgi:hypothetical protein
MKKMSITKKRISAIFFAIILLLTTAMIPTVKVSAAATTAPDAVIYDFFSKTTGVTVTSAPEFTETSEWSFVSAGAPVFPEPDTFTDLQDGKLDGNIDVVIGNGVTQYNLHIEFTCTYPGLAITAECGGVRATASLNGLEPPYVVSAVNVPVPTYNITLTGATGPATAAMGATVTLTPTVPAGQEFVSWSSTPEVTITNNSFTMPASAVSVTATFKDIPAPEPAPTVNQGPPEIVYQPITPINPPAGTGTTPATGDTTTPAAGDTTTPAATPTATPAANVEVSGEISEEGTMTLTIGTTEVETSSTSAAAVIAAGEASEVITSGNAVAVVTTDNAVIAGANASGSMNSASTIAALETAAASLKEGETEVVIAAGDDVSAISAATLRKIAAAAEEAGVTASLTASATDESGAEIATIDIPVSTKTKTSIKTGVEVLDASTDTTVAAREKASGVKVLAAIKTEQKSSFGAKVTLSFDIETLGIEAEEGDTFYVAIKRGDGKTVQAEAKIVNGKLVFTTSSAGTMMISADKFTK